MSTETPTRSSNRRATLWTWIIGGGLFAVLVWLAWPADSGIPLDPRSTGATGTAGILAALEDLGADVSITGRAPETTGPVVVVFDDHLTDQQRFELSDWVERGGRLVLFDPVSPLNPVSDYERFLTDQFGAIDVPPGCELLDEYVPEVRSEGWLIMQPTAGTTESCFVVGDGYGLLVEEVGEGQIVITGVTDALLNVNIRDRGHARLAAALFTPEGADGVVEVLWDDPDGPRTIGGDVALLDLAPTGARAAGGLLIAAALVYALSRARRHGQPVEEELAVRVPGSELALAIGDLLQRHGQVDAAARRLRADARAEAARALALPADVPPDVLVEVLAARYADLEGAAVTLLDRPVDDDEELQQVAAAIARLRRRLLGRPPTGDH